MRALRYSRFQGPIDVVEVPTPIAPVGGALVKVAASGLCRSDWHGWMGHDADIATFPHQPGHEFAGAVTAVGDGVEPAWVGRAVTAPFVYACGDCPVCRSGAGQVCPRQRQPGFSDPGSFAEYVVVQAAPTNLVPLPDGLDPAVAAGLGCRVATAYRAVVARARVRRGEWVAVFGCGGVGLAAVAIAASRGARVVAIDREPAALDRARTVGAETVAIASDTLVDEVAAATDSGVHLSIDAIGSARTLSDAINVLRPRGRHVQIGLLPDDPVIPMARVIGRELDVLGSHGMAAADYGPLLDDVVSGRLDLGALLAPAPPLSLAEAAIALTRLGESSPLGIVLLDPTR